MTHVYPIFIASSLRLEEHRRILAEVIAEVNASPAAQERGIAFEEFLYERRPDLLQKLELHDAQEAADPALRRSPIFFLIIEGRVRDLTAYEFELAMRRFQQGQMPHCIFIFQRTEATEVEGRTEAKGDGLTYAEFCRKYGLENYFYDHDARSVAHKRVYPIPFGSLTEGTDSLRERVATQLRHAIESDALPYPGAQPGLQLEKAHFFGHDTLRLEHCPDMYYRRPVDDDIEQALATSRVVLITGDSLSGKTRAMMEALRGVDDGWIYLFDRPAGADVEAQTLRKIRSLTAYLRRPNPPKLYLAFDDLGVLASESEAIASALRELTMAIRQGTGVLVATATNEDVRVEGINRGAAGVEVLHIGRMTELDVTLAEQYFRSCGVTIDRASLRYRMMGALFVNLDELKDRYRNYPEDVSSWLRQDVRELHLDVRRSLLRAIKLLSLWHEDFLRSLDNVRSFVRYLVDKKNALNEDTFVPLFDSAVQKLCDRGRMGLSITGGKRLDVQEYVCRYFIGYDGQCPSDAPDPAQQEAALKRAIREIMDYCSSPYYPDRESVPLTYQVSRITTRCLFSAEAVGWLYGLWSRPDASDVAPEDRKLADLLRHDAQRCDAIWRQEGGQLLGYRRTDTSVETEAERLMHHHSKIIDNYIYRCCDGDFDAAWIAFTACVPEMRTDHLLCAVMRQARNQSQRAFVRQQADYARLQDEPYVIRAEVEWSTDYASAAQAFGRFGTSEPPAQIAERLARTSEVQYDLLQLNGALNILFTRVATEEDLDAGLAQLRRCYPMLIKSPDILEQVRTGILQVRPEALSLLDLMARVDAYSLSVGLERVYGSHIDAARDLLERMKDAVPATLRGPYTSELEVRLLLCRTGSKLINYAADAGYPYEEVYSKLFLALQMPHPTRPGTELIFRNSYTYTAMMRCKDCRIIPAINLFENHLVRHASDRENPIFINRYTLNLLLAKCWKEDSFYLHKVDALFEQLGVRRDEFTYFNLLRGGKNGKLHLEDCLEIVDEMKAAGVSHNPFTVAALMACEAVPLSMALSCLPWPAALVQNYSVQPFPKLKLPAELKERLGAFDEAWSVLFRKPCTGPEDQALLGRCLAYLERTEHRHILESGKVYNAIAAGNGLLPDVESVIAFVEAKERAGLFVPDAYTARCLVSRASNVHHGAARRQALTELNRFWRTHLTLLDEATYNKNLYFFRRYDERLPLLLASAEGEVVEGEMTPIEYLETMQRLHLPIGRVTIKIFTRKQLGPKPADLWRRLTAVLVAQRDYYTYTPAYSEIVYERCGPRVFDALSDCLPPLSVLSRNKIVTRTYRLGDDANTAPQALAQLDWADENSAATEWNAILSHYIDKAPKNPTTFRTVMNLYAAYFCGPGGHRPSSYTFGVMVKAVSDIEEFRELFRDLERRKVDHPRLVPQPVMLSRLSACLSDLSSLARETCAYRNAGGKADAHSADIYLYRMARYIVRTDPDRTRPLLADVFRFILVGEDKQAKEALCHNEREYLLMSFYEKRANVHAQTLQTIIAYSDVLTPPLPPEGIVRAICDRYATLIPELMSLLMSDRKGDALRTVRYLLLLVKGLRTHAPRHWHPKRFQASLADYIVRTPSLMSDYSFLASLPAQLAQAGMPLSAPMARTLASGYTALYALGGPQAEAAAARTDQLVRLHTEALGRGDEAVGLPGTLFGEGPDGDTLVSLPVEALGDALPDEYLLELRRVAGAQHGRSAMMGRMAQIKRAEARFALRLANGEVPYLPLILPELWRRTGYRPSPQLVLALVKHYFRRADYDAELKPRVKVIAFEVRKSVDRGLETVRLNYRTLGVCPDDCTWFVLVPTCDLLRVVPLA